MCDSFVIHHNRQKIIKMCINKKKRIKISTKLCQIVVYCLKDNELIITFFLCFSFFGLVSIPLRFLFHQLHICNFTIVSIWSCMELQKNVVRTWSFFLIYSIRFEENFIKELRIKVHFQQKLSVRISLCNWKTNEFHQILYIPRNRYYYRYIRLFSSHIFTIWLQFLEAFPIFII